jgi:hypothetical protein
MATRRALVRNSTSGRIEELPAGDTLAGSGGGGGGATIGTSEINFGAFPGTAHATVTIAASGVISSSIVHAWILPKATADHSADEHVIDAPELHAVADTNQIIVHGIAKTLAVLDQKIAHREVNTKSPLAYGVWSIGYQWS